MVQQVRTTNDPPRQGTMPAPGAGGTGDASDGGSRIRLDLSYDGTGFRGWAAQPGLRTVQGVLEEALSRVSREQVRTTVAGRTDSGVHARGQVVHADLSAVAIAGLPGRSDRGAEQSLLDRLDGVLPADIVVHRALRVPSTFDARFSALWRRYIFRISDGTMHHDPLRRDVLRLRSRLDVDAMGAASGHLHGEHDFLSFCRPRDGASTVRTLRELSWRRPVQGQSDSGLVVATVVADAFCHHMVRSLVGALIQVGQGKRGEDWPAQILAAATRTAPTRTGTGSAPIAPPQGLTLEHIEYPADADLATQAALSRTYRG